MKANKGKEKEDDRERTKKKEMWGGGERGRKKEERERKREGERKNKRKKESPQTWLGPRKEISNGLFSDVGSGQRAGRSSWFELPRREAILEMRLVFVMPMGYIYREREKGRIVEEEGTSESERMCEKVRARERA